MTYTLTNNDGGRFAIDATTGIVTVAGAIDRETDGATRSITIRATSSDGSFIDQAFSISIVDADEFDVTAPVDSDATANFVNENAVNGTIVHVTATANDVDATSNSVTYSLDDDAGGRFAVDSVSGVVTVAGAIDREAAASYDIIVRATSSDSSSSTQLFTIAIGDVDEFDTGSVVDTNASANSVVENSAIGTVVGISAQATDADATNNAMTYTLTNNDGGRFAIDATTGVVTLAGAIDREADGATRNITIRATSSDGSFADQAFSISIVDADEFDVTAPVDVDAAANIIDENSANGSVVQLTASASDADATTNAITYSLDDNAGGRFAVDSITGVVTVADSSLLDYEAATSHNLTIRTTSADGSFSTRVFTVNLADVNESSVTAVVDGDATSNFVPENAAVGTVVGITAQATDADGTDSVTYTLDDDAGGRFAVDGVTGIVTVVGAIDREASGSYSIIVRATSSDSSTSTQLFTISIGDVDEFDTGSVSDTNASSNLVVENSVIGTVIGISAQAVDADATNNAITYTLTDNDGGRFTIDASTGVVTVAGAIDREADGPTRSITIRATSIDGSFTDQALSISIVDADEFDVTTPVDSDAALNIINENSANGTIVHLTASATDADATTNSVTYSLDDSAGGRFAVDSVTGMVTVADVSLLDYEAAISHNLTIRATSTDGSFSTRIFTVNLADVNEFAVSAVVDADATSDFVLENAGIGTAVGITAFASDADATNHTITYSLTDNDSGRFAIDGTTGIVTVAGAIDRETDGATRNITIRATSSDGSYSEQSVAIAIGDVNEFNVSVPADANPIFNAIAENSINGSVVGVTAFAMDSDATGNSVHYHLLDDAGGRFAIDSQTGVVTVAASQLLNYENASSHTIVLQAISIDGSTASQSMVIAISDVNEAPTASSFSFTTNNVQTLNISSSVLSSGMSDPDGNVLTTLLTAGPSNGLLILNSDGSFQYSANPGFVGEDSFVYQASDGQLNSTPMVVRIVVGLPPVNPNGGSTGGSTSGSGSSGGSSSNSSTSSNASNTSSNTNTTNSQTTESTPSETSVNPGSGGQDNSRIAERSMEAQQSASTGTTDAPGTAALTLSNSASNVNSQIAAAQLGDLGWDPLMVSSVNLRESGGEEGTRLATRRTGDVPILVQREISQLEQVQGQDYSSFVEPAKWTVISTGVVIWAVRLGHIITTFASTASAWVYFDPLTVIQSAKQIHDSDDTITESMFDARGKQKART